ncbi:MAG: hypothetical protein KC466_12315, partial [Myxococcales bacterium]|nr:hypothetical protein [Myxococcales bacterium]
MSKIKHRIRNASAVLAVAGVALGGAAWIRSADGWAGGGVDFKAMAKAGGGVTYEDYEREVRATLACLSDHGLKTKGPTPSGAGRFLKYGYGVDHRTEAERERKEAEA